MRSSLWRIEVLSTDCASISSDASSSISVVSVPFEVTGDGPTMSLGLMMCMLFEDIRFTEFGRSSDDESVGGGGEERTLKGERKRSFSAGPDMSSCFAKEKWRFPVDDRSGASRAMARTARR
jgi:hypothetical protein